VIIEWNFMTLEFRQILPITDKNNLEQKIFRELSKLKLKNQHIRERYATWMKIALDD